MLATPTLEDGAPAANDPVPVTAPVSEGTAASAPVSAPASVPAAGVSGAGLAEAPASEAAPGVMAASPGLSKATANEEPGAGVSTTSRAPAVDWKVAGRLQAMEAPSAEALPATGWHPAALGASAMGPGLPPDGGLQGEVVGQASMTAPVVIEPGAACSTRVVGAPSVTPPRRAATAVGPVGSAATKRPP